MGGRIQSLVRSGRRLECSEVLALAACDDLYGLTQAAAALRDAGHETSISFSRKVFIPLTQLCRDVALLHLRAATQCGKASLSA
jgi:FO synthase